MISYLLSSFTSIYWNKDKQNLKGYVPHTFIAITLIHSQMHKMTILNNIIISIIIYFSIVSSKPLFIKLPCDKTENHVNDKLLLVDSSLSTFEL